MNSFYHEMKDLVFDSTAIPENANMALVNWTVSQASQISNSLFLMPNGTTHIGIVSVGADSPFIFQDLVFRGGGMGWLGTSTQYHFKKIQFQGVSTGIRPLNTVQISVQGCSFKNISIGVNMSNYTIGLLNMFDTKATDTKVLVHVDANMPNSIGSIVLKNIDACSNIPIAVKASNSALLTGSVEPGNLWIRGHIYEGDDPSTTPEMSAGRRLWGESFTQLSGRGAFFKDPLNLQPIIRVGDPGEEGIAQFTDILSPPCSKSTWQALTPATSHPICGPLI
ncbi:hypothetical protein NX059_000054 [Plenodomus lindquistii]|nr:hypothetical protein NX059_000054 [Plenodomus lindquistii]